VREVRSHGLLAAIELHAPNAGPLVEWQRRGLLSAVVASALAADEGVLLLPAVGESNVLRFIPPLVISPAELEQATSALDRTLSRLERQSSWSTAR
jgi:acetylornithine/succinyldiaminopimelate/putrescine aminotransferase